MKYTIAAAAFALALTTSVHAANITTGSKGKSYFKAGYKLGKLIGGNNTVMVSKGSMENLERVDKGTADIGFTQLDAYVTYMQKNPNAEIEILGPLYDECVYMAVKKGGKINDEDDIQKDTHIAVGKLGSGTQITFDYMRQLENDYARATVDFAGGNRTLAKVAVGGDNNPDALMWVQKCGTIDGMVSTVIKNKDLKFIPIDDHSLNNKYKPLGRPVYTFKKIDAKKGWGGSFKTISTEAVVIANPNADEDVLDKAASIMMNYRESVIK